MAFPPRSLLRLLQYLGGLVLLGTLSQALKLDLQAVQGGFGRERCIRNFVGRDTLVVVTAIVSGSKGDGMVVNMNVSEPFLAGSEASLGLAGAVSSTNWGPTDQRRRGQRVRPGKGHRRRAAHRVYVARGCGL